MVFPLHSRLSFRGILGTVAAPYEIWSFRLNFAWAGSEIDGQPVIDAAVANWPTQMAPLMQPNAILTEIKWAPIGADGRYTQDPTIEEVEFAGSGSATGAKPPQIACAVSLMTDRRGPTGRGRIYLPLPPGGLDGATGLWPALNADTTSQNVAAFITQLNGPAGFGNVSVVSSKGFASGVTAVRTGRVLDTIRSRRNALEEAYTTAVAV